MICPHCNKDIENKAVLSEAASINGKKSTFIPTSDHIAKMIQGRRKFLERKKQCSTQT